MDRSQVGRCRLSCRLDPGPIRIRAAPILHRRNEARHPRPWGPPRSLAIVGERLFAVSGGPERTELIVMAWWNTRNGKERLRVVERWTLQDSRSQIDGFTLAPSTDSRPMESFYINMNFSIRVYSVPARSEHDEDGQSSPPMKLKSLNMKVLTQGMTVGDQENDDRLSTMITFEGVTYILRSNASVQDAWNLADGTLVSEIKLPELPATDEDNTMVKWKGFALERKIATDSTDSETPNVRGGDVQSMRASGASDALFLHLMTDEATFGGQIWSFPVLEHIGTPSGLFSAPDCQIIATTSMN